MPIFEYICARCDHRFEAIVHGSTTPHCPSCDSDDLQKQLSVFAVGSSSGSSSGNSAGASFAPAPCGRCGDPRGPGACSLDN
jgi:putative FmdB family regulatory protein